MELLNSGVLVLPAGTSGTEGSCQSASSKFDEICWNATDHAAELSNNGGTFGHILAAGSSDAKGLQTQRTAGCQTGAATGETCDTTVIWSTPFADTNYTATCAGDAVVSGIPMVEGMNISAAQGAGSITVRTYALSAAAAQFKTIDCVAVHD
jgi:hypothetical protein